MKNHLLLSSMFVVSITFSQTSISSRFNLIADTLKMAEYKAPDVLPADSKKMKLKVNYGDFEIVNPKDADKIRNANIAVIDLVYTEFPKGQDFRALNKKRLEYLHLICPEIFDSKIVRWRIIGITKCKTDYEASQTFHGFVIYYLPGSSKDAGREEYSFLKRVMSGKEKLLDSTVLKIFKRNKWKNCAVVADFTGSMSPYVAELLLWYGLTFASNPYTDFTFFNDGDMNGNEGKMIGSTGGIYYCKSGNQDTVLNTALRCVQGGSGGDAPENNIEALLYTIKKNPHLKEIILIADNWSSMRDYALISKIKIPVRVIVCGYEKYPYLNIQYLDLASQTKGSIHTIEEDIDKLKEIKEGKTIKIGKEVFKLSGGRFFKVSTT